MNQINCFDDLSINHNNLLYKTKESTHETYYGKDINDNYVVVIFYGIHLTLKINRLSCKQLTSNKYLITKEVSDDEKSFILSDIMKCMRIGKYWELDLLKYGLVLEDDFADIN